jgi:cytoskeletal protein CcmA (bactofilin family)
VYAKSVVILGEVTGNVTASEKVDLRDNGSVDGDIAAPRVAIAEGAHFRGSIDMQRAAGKPAESRTTQTASPASVPSSSVQSSQPAPAAAAGPR